MVYISKSKVSLAGIFLEGFLRLKNKVINFLNLYWLSNNRRIFWDQLRDEGILKYPQYYCRGDLNLVLSSNEVWGDNSHMDVLAPFFLSLFEYEGLVDVVYVPIRPTW